LTAPENRGMIQTMRVESGCGTPGIRALELASRFRIGMSSQP
jgi:hypothetical protein